VILLSYLLGRTGQTVGGLHTEQPQHRACPLVLLTGLDRRVSPCIFLDSLSTTTAGTSPMMAISVNFELLLLWDCIMFGNTVVFGFSCVVFWWQFGWRLSCSCLSVCSGLCVPVGVLRFSFSRKCLLVWESGSSVRSGGLLISCAYFVVELDVLQELVVFRFVL
jgi:hypothetical protein